MSGYRHPMTARNWITIVVLSTGAGVFGSQEPGRSRDRTGSDSEGQATLRSLDRRLRELERRIEAALGPRSRPPARQPVRIVADSVHKIRPRFPCWIDKVAVKAGQTVKQGDLLADLSSIELDAAKNDFLAKTRRFKYARMALDYSQEVRRKGGIASAVWTDYEGDVETSRRELTFARDQLLVYGLSPREIDAVKDEKDRQKAHFAVRAPIDGVVLDVLGWAGDPAGPRSVLLTIGTVAP